jgi:hypothetical protein
LSNETHMPKNLYQMSSENSYMYHKGGRPLQITANQ